MKKGYWVVAYRSISNASAVKAYGALAVPAVQSFGGRFLTASTSQMQVHEAGLQQRTVLVEFDSFDIARSVHESEAYQGGAGGAEAASGLVIPGEGRVRGEGFEVEAARASDRFVNWQTPSRASRSSLSRGWYSPARKAGRLGTISDSASRRTERKIHPS